MLLFVMTMIMFALSTVYWILSVIVTFLVINAWFSKLDPATHVAPNWSLMFNAPLSTSVLSHVSPRAILLTDLPPPPGKFDFL